MKSSRILCVDVGNSRLKWGVCNTRDLSFDETGCVDYQSKTISDGLSTSLSKIKKMPVWVGCVASGQIIQKLESWFEDNWQITIDIIGVDSINDKQLNGYSIEADLGIDRWLAMIAGRHRYNNNYCVIDAGTATTIDVVDAVGVHVGGVIMPSKALMLSALGKGTANIDNSFGNVMELAVNTADGVASGVAACVLGGIEKKLREIEKNYSGIVFVLTGGGAVFINEFLDFKFNIENNLVLEGVGLVAQNKYA